MMVGQPVEFAQFQGRVFTVAMGPLHVLGVLEEMPLFVSPMVDFFQQSAVGREQLQFADMVVTPVHGQVRHQVVVVHETVVGQTIGVAKLAVPGAGGTIGVDGADPEAFVVQTVRDQRGHGPAQTVTGNQDGQAAIQRA